MTNNNPIPESLKQLKLTTLNIELLSIITMAYRHEIDWNEALAQINGLFQPLLDANYQTIMYLTQTNEQLQEKLDAQAKKIKELEALIEDYWKQSTLTYCVYCRASFPMDDDTGAKVTEHIKSCTKHPLFMATEEIKGLKKSVSELLEAMHRHELDVDVEAPFTHRAMMKRATDALKVNKEESNDHRS